MNEELDSQPYTRKENKVSKNPNENSKSGGIQIIEVATILTIIVLFSTGMFNIIEKFSEGIDKSNKEKLIKQ